MLDPTTDGIEMRALLAAAQDALRDAIRDTQQQQAVATLTCTRCGRVLPDDAFGRKTRSWNVRHRRGRHSACRECRRLENQPKRERRREARAARAAAAEHGAVVTQQHRVVTVYGQTPSDGWNLHDDPCWAADEHQDVWQ